MSETNSTIVMGVDAGGSKTKAVLASVDGVLSEGLAGPGNHQGPGGFEAALTEIQRSMEACLTAGSFHLEDVAYTILGVAGADFPEDYVRINHALSSWFGDRPFTVVNDAEIALMAGSRTGVGIVTVLGTATNVFGINSAGKRLGVGGLGFPFGDLGGAIDLVPRVLHCAFRSAEGRGPKTRLESAILEALDLPDVHALRRTMYFSEHPEEYQRLAPLVFLVAQAGDRVAQDVLIEMGTKAGESAGACARGLEMVDGPVEMVLSGSLWTGPGPYLVDAFTLNVHRYAPAAVVRPSPLEPVAGAIRLAWERLDAAVNWERMLPTLKLLAVGSPEGTG